MFETTVDTKFFETEVSNARLVVTLSDPYEIAGWLPDLASGKIRAIRVPNWRSAPECAIDVAAMEKCMAGSYAQEPTLAKGGPTVYDFEGRENDSSEYFEQAAVWNPVLRRILYPRITAADHLAAIMNETHPAGVAPEQLVAGKVPSMQVTRKFDVDSRAGAHVDRTDWDWPSNVVAASQQALISSLSYHQVAEIGGELVLYGDKIDRATWIKAKIPGSPYELDARHLNPKPIIIVPKLGELIMFNAHLAHQVKMIVKGTRITSSNFYAWRGIHLPLGRFA